MSKSELKEKLNTLINNLDDEELLKEIYQMISHDSTPYKLSEEQKLHITRAKHEISQGLFRTHEEVKKRTSEWLEN
jgi:hypothetical protein